MAQLPFLKSGDSFGAIVTYTDSAGAPINMTTGGVTVSSQVRDSIGTLVSQLTVALLDQTTNPGQFSLSASTVGWPINTQLFMDLKYTTGGTVITHTDNIALRIEPVITV